MAKIISIGTALPDNCYQQIEILKFMQQAYRLNESESRKLAFLYKHCDIENRYSVLEDFGKPESEWKFIKRVEDEPTVDERMEVYNSNALTLSVQSIKNCIEHFITPNEITHLITVSCTGMSAPGLDLQVAEELQLAPNIFRTSVNFMGCYAAIHALKLAEMMCRSADKVNVVVVCTELCTIHFQQQYTQDNAASSLLFGDGSAAVLISNCLTSFNSLTLQNFYSKVAYKGKNDMSWQISNKGFLMKLSSYIPQFISEDIAGLVSEALEHTGIKQDEITDWCVHPGGKKILEVIKTQLGLPDEALSCSREILSKYGNMSSPTILFVLNEIMKGLTNKPAKVFGVAFGPGLTMETFIASR